MGGPFRQARQSHSPTGRGTCVITCRAVLANYQLIYAELNNRIMHFPGKGNQRRALDRFGEFVNGSARVLLVST